jgi:hypothetical protein
VQCEHECHDEKRRQHKRSGDHERRRGVEAVVPADGDAEQRRDGGEREQDRERQPLVLRRRVSRDDDSCRDESGKGDDGCIGGGRGRQAADSPRLPTVSCNCWDAHFAAAPLSSNRATVATNGALLTIGKPKSPVPQTGYRRLPKSRIATPAEYGPDVQLDQSAFGLTCDVQSAAGLIRAELQSALVFTFDVQWRPAWSCRMSNRRWEDPLEDQSAVGWFSRRPVGGEPGATAAAKVKAAAHSTMRTRFDGVCSAFLMMFLGLTLRCTGGTTLTLQNLTNVVSFEILETAFRSSPKRRMAIPGFSAHSSVCPRVSGGIEGVPQEANVVVQRFGATFGHFERARADDDAVGQLAAARASSGVEIPKPA